MALFQNPFFKSDSDFTERQYEIGVRFLAEKDYGQANQYLKKAAEDGHISALYNLAILHGSGVLEPIDVDFAAECFYKAAHAGHPSAQQNLFMLEAADRAGMGTTHLANLALNSPPVDGMLPYLVMITGCRFYAAVCKATDATQQVINYELDAASSSEHAYIQSFIRRCGVPELEFSGGLHRLKEGDAADQITDGLNQLFMSMKQVGYADEICLMARCTIVSYIISRSKYAASAPQLHSVNVFLNPPHDGVLTNKSQRLDSMGLSSLFGLKKDIFIIGGVKTKLPETDEQTMRLVSEITQQLAQKLPTEQDIYWFVIEFFDRANGFSSAAREILKNLPMNLLEMEYAGRRSENSYVGKKNPGVAYLLEDVAPSFQKAVSHLGAGPEQVIVALVYLIFCNEYREIIKNLRIKYAVHYHNNCISSGSFNNADKWGEVIGSLE